VKLQQPYPDLNYNQLPLDEVSMVSLSLVDYKLSGVLRRDDDERFTSFNKPLSDLRPSRRESIVITSITADD